MPTSEKEVATVLEKLESLNLKNLDTSTLLDKFINWSIDSGVRLIVGLLIISIGFKIIKKVVNKFEHFLEKRDVDVTLRRFLKSFSIGGLKAILVLLVVTLIWDVKLTGLVALFTSAGVAIGLALQGSLSNFAGGFIILLLRPFKVGDYIQAAGYEGTVEQIGVFYTHLLTIDNKVALIPNGTLSNNSLINFSAKENRRVDLIFNVSYENNVIHVREVLKEIIDNHPLISHDPEPFIGIVEHAQNSVNFGVRVWCNKDDYWTIYYDLLEQVKVRFDEENITIPYPQMDLHVNYKTENKK
ncbi:mechanosensitive ion channel family protein [Romboutsia ilealis]|uniref:Mechanosensitive ion channel n=1 Tax=Romboutsia faecis TaxID=2764597 RepID=A0ABR7JSL7_9FIRM|nr:mechanosensitive ion channel domain-containing protein [Romboutsia faecis]MBC5997908.1 mechanosensitive ion channel [Romboutsia faecis]MRN25603.1 mechanosensitive ion channel family protein [Romboutsia ilealis]